MTGASPFTKPATFSFIEFSITKFLAPLFLMPNAEGKLGGRQASTLTRRGAPTASDPGLTSDGHVRGVFSIVQMSIIAMMGGCASEMALLGHEPPKYIGIDIPNASRIAIAARRPASRVFANMGYQESLALSGSTRKSCRLSRKRWSIIRRKL